MIAGPWEPVAHACHAPAEAELVCSVRGLLNLKAVSRRDEKPRDGLMKAVEDSSAHCFVPNGRFADLFLRASIDLVSQEGWNIP